MPGRDLLRVAVLRLEQHSQDCRSAAVLVFFVGLQGRCSSI